MSERFDGRRAVVTGAGRNVGEAIVRRLTREGARVAVVDIDLGAANRVAKSLEAERPGCAVPIAADVSAGADVRQCVDTAWESLGHIDTLVNCVAITDRPATVLDLEDDVWRQVLEVTLTSAYLTSKYLAQRMVAEQRGGTFVHIGSTSGMSARGNALAYPTAKAGLYGLIRSLAVQLGRHGITVNTVTPNKVGSPVGQATEPENRGRRNLLGRACTPEDIANAVAFVASAEASFITGTDIRVDGGALIVTGD